MTKTRDSKCSKHIVLTNRLCGKKAKQRTSGAVKVT